jgi:hypothetical protein
MTPSPLLLRHPARRVRGSGAGGRQKTALARLHSGRVAQSSAAALRCRGRGLVRGPSGARSLGGGMDNKSTEERVTLSDNNIF